MIFGPMRGAAIVVSVIKKKNLHGHIKWLIRKINDITFIVGKGSCVSFWY